jgi:organic hydroperoxide reductase OsmC/OhrA
MTNHAATIAWERAGATFTDNRYSRAHTWRFDGGVTVPASSSPHVVPLPMSDPAGVDPEEAYVAALASCHMLWFLGLAAAQGYVIDRYTDAALGFMERNSAGKDWVARVELRPVVVFGGTRVPDDAQLARLHHAAHAECFLANSVRTRIVIEGAWRGSA